MATRTWLGVDGNWNNTSNWSGGAVPVDGDSVVIADGTIDITSGLDQTGVNLVDLYISFGANIGSDGAYLTIGVTGKLTWIGSGQTVRIAAEAGGIAKAVIAPQGMGTFVVAGSGTYTLIEGGRQGRIEIASGATVTTLRTAGAGVYADAGTAFTTLDVAGGYAQTFRSVGTATVQSGARLETRSTAAVSTKVTTYPGGYFNHKSSGTVAHSEAYPNAVATSAGSPYNFTLTNATTWVGGKNFQQESNVITQSNATVPVGYLA